MDKDLINKLLPYQSNFVTVAGFRMHYLDEGLGPVVILLHGNPTWCFYYRNLVATLKKNFRVIVPDYINMGLSERVRKVHFRAQHRIQHLSEFIDQLGLTKYSLVMHDWGGAIGTGHAVRFPERIEKLVYLNTTLTETETLPLMIKAAAHPIIGRLLTRTTKQFLRFTTKLGVARKLSKDIVRGYHWPYRRRIDRQVIWDFVADIPFDSKHPSYADMLDLAMRIPLLKDKPVQIVWGLKDPCFHREMLNKVAKHFPQANILEIPDASHLVLEDAPEVAGRKINDFLLDHSVITSAQVELSHTSQLYAAFVKQVELSSTVDAVIEASFLTDTIKYAKFSFADLSSIVNKYQRGLTELGLIRGDRVLMLVTPGANFLALSMAVMGRGAIPVFLDPGMGREKLFKCIQDLRPDVFIGSAKAFALKVLKRDLFSSCRFSVLAAEFYGAMGPDLSYLKKFADRPLAHVESTGTALVAYTSGATGTPKGVVFTDENVQAQLAIFKNEFGMQAGAKDLPLLPIFSLFTIGLGVTSIIPPLNPGKPLELDPTKILKLLEDHQVNYSFGSPTLWKKISEYCLRSRSKLTTLEKVYIAGAPVPLDTLQVLQELLVKGEAFTPYGATEALPVSLVAGSKIINHSDQASLSGEQGVFVGAPVVGVELRVIKTSSVPIDNIGATELCSTLEIGEIIVSGANVSRNYLDRPDADKNAKINDGTSIWHRMGDVGYLDQQGNLYFCGRKAHIVAVQNKLYYSVPIERIFNRHPKVARSALVALGSVGGSGGSVGAAMAAIVVEPHPQHWPQNSLEREHFIAELIALGKQEHIATGINLFFFHPSFPVDGRHNAKIFRDQLGEWAKEELDKKQAA